MKNEERLIVQFDMDNTLIRFESGIEKISEEDRVKYEGRLDEVPGIFALMEPLEGAVEAFTELSKICDCYILSTAPWENDTAWSDKLNCVKKYFAKDAYKRLTLSHNKQLAIGHILVDDRKANGAGEFKGELVQFGTEQFPNWDVVVPYIKQKALEFQESKKRINE
ncbi:5' nucleotidase, NT5C type [Vibrio splendidus]|nr:hypothetical protein [Vibrio splendidus]MCC4880350.1 hypothetical protein [Vibrio splendidus]